MAIITRLKNALEFARFPDPNIREALVDAINELALDMDELEFEEAANTRAVFAKLDAALSEFENRETPITPPAPISDDIDEEPESVLIVDAEIEVDEVIPVEPSDDDIEL